MKVKLDIPKTVTVLIVCRRKATFEAGNGCKNGDEDVKLSGGYYYHAV